MNDELMVQEQGEELETVELLTGSEALAAVDRAGVDAQVATAKRYPRSIDRALKEALTLATLDEDTAGSMFYSLPRDGKHIEGPSARLAEVMAYSWGNLRADADIVAEDRQYVTAMGTCFDCEKNVAVRVRVKRRITDKRGRRYSDDMVVVTSNAAISIALRNAVFKVIPQAFVRRIYQEARRASLGKGGTIAQKRQNAMGWFAKVGLDEPTVCGLLNVRGLDDIGEDELITLRGLRTALQEGDTTVEELLAPKVDAEATNELNEAIKAKSAKKPKAAPAEAPAEEGS